MEDTLVFSKEKYLSQTGINEWWRKIDGKEVTFHDNSNLGRCDGYYILRDWCKPSETINNSDN